MSPYNTEDDRNTTLCTLWTTPSVTRVINSFAHAHSSEIRGANFKRFKTSVDLQGCPQTLVGDPRTGTFPQMRVTTSDTICSVKGLHFQMFFVMAHFQSCSSMTE